MLRLRTIMVILLPHMLFYKKSINKIQVSVYGVVHMICSCASCCNSSQVKTTETWYPLYYWSFATMLIVNANCWDSSEKIISFVYFCNYFPCNNKGWDHCKKWFWLVLLRFKLMNYVKFYIWGCVSAMYTLCACVVCIEVNLHSLRPII